MLIKFCKFCMFYNNPSPCFLTDYMNYLCFTSTKICLRSLFFFCQKSSVGLENIAQPTGSNAASADSIMSCKTEPNACFARQTSNLSFSGLTGDSSNGEYQDCGASPMLVMGEPPPWCTPESSLASSTRSSAVQRYKDKKKTRK